MSEVEVHTAWKMPPHEYLAQRSAAYRVPVAPASRYVTMSDGCRLAVDVYLPVGEQPHDGFPTVVIFTPYLRRFQVSDGQVDPSPNAARYRDFFVRYGYALVVVDVRGTGASFGTRDTFRSPREREDTREIADWIVAQSWSNGSIGCTGISYLGASACFLASTGHPAVKAIAPLFAVADIYGEQLYPGGMMSRVWSRAYDELMIALDGNDVALRARFPYFNDPRLLGPQSVDDDSDGTQLAAALAEHRDNFRLHDLLPEWAFREQGALHDAELTTDLCSPFHYLKTGARPGLPIYSISGWYDGGGYANGAISRFLTMAGPHDRLLLGPWDHGARTDVSPWRQATVPQFPVLGEVLRFFDTHLLGMASGLEDEAPVHYFSLHAEQWREAQTWPPTGATKWHLTSDAGLAPHPELQQTTMAYQVRFDIGTGQRTRWERLGTANIDIYYDDWQDRDQDHLCFTSAACHEDIEISGHVVAHLKVSASQSDAGFFVYLAEVEADGTVRYITEGHLRALHRKTVDHPDTYVTTWPYRSYTMRDARQLEIGRAETIAVPLLPVSWTLRAGSRLRLSLAGADADHFPQVPHGRPPKLTYLVGGADGCALELPMMARTAPQDA